MISIARRVVFVAALMAPALAMAFVPDADPVSVSVASSLRLGNTACTKAFSVAASEVRTWRVRLAGASEPVRGSVICDADSSFKGMPARYRVECSLHRTLWKCEAGIRELLVPTLVGVVGVIPNDVPVGRAVDSVQMLAAMEYVESKDFGRIPIKDSLAQGCWLASTSVADTVKVQCGPSAVWVALNRDGVLHIERAAWSNP